MPPKKRNRDDEGTNVQQPQGESSVVDHSNTIGGIKSEQCETSASGDLVEIKEMLKETLKRNTELVQERDEVSQKNDELMKEKEDAVKERDEAIAATVLREVASNIEKFVSDEDNLVRRVYWNPYAYPAITERVQLFSSRRHLCWEVVYVSCFHDLLEMMRNPTRLNEGDEFQNPAVLLETSEKEACFAIVLTSQEPGVTFVVAAFARHNEWFSLAF